MKNDSESCEPITKRTKSSDDMEKDLQEEEYHDAEASDNENEKALNAEDDDYLFPFPPDDDATDMLESVKYHGLFPTTTDRYFTSYYKLNVQNPGDDIRILMHSNRICMLTLAPSHIVLKNDTEITKVDFKVSDKLNRVLNKVSGKSKHGAQPLQGNSNICIITCSNGKTYTIKCCVIGKLVEANETLLENPKLLLEPPHKGGYLAIVLPNIKLLDKMKESLLTQEQYESKMTERKNTSHLEISEVSETMDNSSRLNNKDQITVPVSC